MRERSINIRLYFENHEDHSGSMEAQLRQKKKKLKCMKYKES